MIYKKIVWFGIIGIFIASFVPNIILNYWFIDIFSHFKVQYIFISILLLLITFSTFKKTALPIIILVLSIIWNSTFIIPYYFKPNVSELSKDQHISVSSINLFSSNSNYHEVINYIEKENSDILILMELTPNWKKKLNSIIDDYKYKLLIPRSDNFGIGLLSKFPIDLNVDYFELNNKPSIIGNCEINNKLLTVIATHPIPPVSQLTFENRNKQLLYIIENRSKFAENLIVIGDFNISSFSPHFKKLVLDDLKDSRIGFGLLPTWPAGFGIMQTTLDHCLVSRNIEVLKRSIGINIGSDHKPINITIEIN